MVDMGLKPTDAPLEYLCALTEDILKYMVLQCCPEEGNLYFNNYKKC